jgi:hypothetical protein
VSAEETPITLEPEDYPFPPVTMRNLVPANAGGSIDLGPQFLDSETVAALGLAIAEGLFTVNPEWQVELQRSNNAALEAKFLERLRRTPLSPSSPALHHRRLALFEAVRELGSEGAVVGFGLTVHNVTRAIGDVETWLEGKRQELAQQVGLGEAELVRLLQGLTPAQLAGLLQVAVATLQQWREAGIGPAFYKTSPRTIRYPVVAVIEWLNENMRRAS